MSKGFTWKTKTKTTNKYADIQDHIQTILT